MKRALNVNLGSSDHDLSSEFDFPGHPFLVQRKVDAICFGGPFRTCRHLEAAG